MKVKITRLLLTLSSVGMIAHRWGRVSTRLLVRSGYHHWDQERLEFQR